MKTLIAVSDTHCLDLRQVLKGKEADILIHAGDALTAGTVQEWHKFLRFLEHLSGWFGKIIYVPGNHDKYVEANQVLCEQQLRDLNITMLIDKQTIVHGIKFYGSPWVPYINGHWAWEMRLQAEAEHVWAKIPESTDILVTHTPPHGVLDQSVWTKDSKLDVSPNFGCASLRDRLAGMIKPPSIGVCGHIHSGHGARVFNRTHYFNVSIMGEQYLPIYEPTVIELDEI